jgi:hypothetical protein
MLKRAIEIGFGEIMLHTATQTISRFEKRK